MEKLDLKELIKTLWDKKILIGLVTILGLIIVCFYNSKMTTPIYESSTTVILSVTENLSDKKTVNIMDQEEQNITTDDLIVTEKLISTYSQIIKSESVMEEVISNLGLNMSQSELLKNVVVKRESDSAVIKITVKNTNPELADKIAKEIPNVFFEKLKTLYNITSAKVLDMPKVAKSPSNIRPLKYAIIGAIIGFMLSIVIVFIEKILNENVKKESDLEHNLKIPVLASIGKISEKSELVSLNKNSAYSEVFRVLISNIRDLDSKVILIISNAPREGKSWISSNLAVTYARSGKKTLLIDGDMRCGRQHLIFNLDVNGEGLSNIIDECNNDIEVDLNKYIASSVIENLDVITRGTAYIDYSKLLFSDAIEKIIQVARNNYDFIIVDGTPSSIVADDMNLTKVVDSTMIVVKYDKTKLSDVKKIKRKIEKNKGKVMGAIINEIPKITKKYENSYYGYSSSKQLTSKVKNIYEMGRRYR